MICVDKLIERIYIGYYEERLIHCWNLGGLSVEMMLISV